jgi:hypothetical protein
VADLVPPTFYPCPESTGTPHATCALTRLATSLGRLTPSTRSGNKCPERSTGASNQLENVVVTRTPPALPLLFGLFYRVELARETFSRAPSGTIPNST